jgi:predicted lipoprotein
LVAHTINPLSFLRDMTVFIKYTKLLVLYFVAVSLLGCGGGGKEPGPEDNTKDRQLILTNWVDNIVVPAYANFKVKFDAMLTKKAAFAATPNESTLIEFRSTWVEAYIAWQKVEPFDFGPANKYTLRNFFNIYPADVAGITTNINDPSTALDVTASYARQGFPALDYLINGVGADDASIIAYYTDETEGTKRIAYINRITDRMNTLLTNVIGEWGGTYRETFISNTSLDIGSSMGLVVNAFVLNFERFIRSGKIGIPSGISSGGVLFPEKVEAFYKKDISLTLVKTAHQAMQDFFNGVSVADGTEGPSFKSYLDGLGAKDAGTGVLLSKAINDQFSLITNELNQLSQSLYDQIQNDNQAMIDTHTEMQKLVYIFKADMSSAMSITIIYTDNDGD